jgi:accessory colonization factor AcfC
MKAVIAGLVFVFLGVYSQKPKPPERQCLHIYGSSGPLAPMKECADTFSKYSGAEVIVVGGPASEWIARAEADGDVVFGGAEYVLTQIEDSHPNLVDKGTHTSLYSRGVGVLVRRGNPRHITSLSDLTKPGTRILAVEGASQQGLWEDMAGQKDLIPAIRKNILVSVATPEEAMTKWKSMPGLDAWLTYESWYYHLKDVTDLVRLPEQERIYRGTCLAVAKSSKNREIAMKFIEFLKTDTAHAVFQKWGWR